MHVLVLHEVGGCDSGGARDAHEAVHEDGETLLAVLVNFVDDAVEEGQKLVLRRVVGVVYVVQDAVGGLVEQTGLRRHREDHPDAARLQTLHLLGAGQIAHEQPAQSVGGHIHAGAVLTVHRIIININHCTQMPFRLRCVHRIIINITAPKCRSG